METVEPTPSFEVRCHRCACSFAAGTRHCVHCGERLGLAPPLPFAPAGGHPDAESEGQAPSFGRVALWLVSAGAALVLSALQTCNR